jgi:membrane protein
VTARTLASVDAWQRGHAVLGFVLEGDPSLQADIVDSAPARIPIIGTQLDDEVAPLTGSALGLAFGRAFQELWDVPRLCRRGPIRARVYGLAALIVFGAVLVASTLLTGLATGGGVGPAAESVGALALSLIVNAAVFLAGFSLPTQRPRRMRELLPGVSLAAIGSLRQEILVRFNDVAGGNQT